MCGSETARARGDFLQHLGSASLAIGLLCIGAGLQWKAFKEELSLMAASSMQRLVAVPLVGWATASVFGLGAVESGVLILFAALPTAQSCYVMTASMRGNAAAVANVTTAQTLVSMVTLSVWCAFVLEPLAGKSDYPRMSAAASVSDRAVSVASGTVSGTALPSVPTKIRWGSRRLWRPACRLVCHRPSRFA